MGFNWWPCWERQDAKSGWWFGTCFFSIIYGIIWIILPIDWLSYFSRWLLHHQPENDDVAVVLEQRILVFWAVGDRGPPNYHPRFFLNGETDGDECCTKFEKPPYIIDFFFRVGSMNCPISLDSCGDSPMFLASLLNLFQRWPPTVTVLDKMTIIVVMCYYCYYIYTQIKSD